MSPSLHGSSIGGIVNEVIYNEFGRLRTDGCTKAVGHHHEESLSRRTHVFCCFLIYIECTRDIEEIKGKAIYDAAQNEHPYARTGIACAEEAKA